MATARTQPRFGLDYEKLDLKQLQALVVQRNGQRNGLPQSRWGCMKVLRQMDKDFKFLFFDLKPELRNRVYEILLCGRGDEGKKVYPAILRSCKQANDEARGLLYVDSTINIEAHIFAFDDVFKLPSYQKRREERQRLRKYYDLTEQERLDLQESGQLVDPFEDLEIDGEDPGSDAQAEADCKLCIFGDMDYRPHQVRLDRLYERWPSKLEKIPSVRLRIYMRCDPVFGIDTNPIDTTALNKFLYALVSKLNEGSIKQKVHITFVDRLGVDYDALAHAFYPLAKFRDGIEVEYEDMPTAIIDFVNNTKAAKGDALCFNMVKEILSVSKELDALLNANLSMSHLRALDLACLRDWIGRLQDCQHRWLITSSKETFVWRKLRYTRAVMGATDVLDADATMREWITGNAAAWRAYEVRNQGDVQYVDELIAEGEEALAEEMYEAEFLDRVWGEGSGY
ncbi:hypothetical protein AC578_3167 [Pseudocercospora eumusae]|uniref:Uncharacterized protein n=1 Tax=Pseudocercospora eumusae TaxID=321146 RepID=A0A139HDT7_9PEZI|nr:hypothetical protein AC578_3167 [Pseudocercospora eumusae]